MDKRVLVVGDVMLDKRIEGEMTRISPESPSPVVRHARTTMSPGGAANVAANVAGLGSATLLLGVAGGDEHGDQLSGLLAGVAGLTKRLVRVTQPTITKTRVTCGGQQVMRLDYEELPLGGYGQQHAEGVLAALADIRGQVAAVVVADYGKGTMSPAVVEAIMRFAAAEQSPVFVDCKPAAAAAYRGAAVLKPNFREAVGMCDDLVHPAMAGAVGEDDKVAVMAPHIRSKYGVGCVIVTRGGGGATCFDGQTLFTAATSLQEVCDVTGAGDTFMAALVDSFVRRSPLPAAVARANVAAGCAVQRRGTHVVSAREVDAAARKQLGAAGKIMSADEAALLAVEWRNQRRRIVLTNGCFRALHHGHLATLKWARAQGDVLVVAVNTDTAIRQLKGDDRLVVPQADRFDMLASLPFVDAVVPFDEPDATATVRAIDPDVLVKGGDYAGQPVAGGEWVARSGGQVLFAPLLAGFSSSKFDLPSCRDDGSR